MFLCVDENANKQEISLQFQQIRHSNTLVSTNYVLMLIVMDVISVQQHTCAHTHTNTYFYFQGFYLYPSSPAWFTHTRPVFCRVLRIPPISFLEGYTIFLPSLPFHMPSPPLLVLPSSLFLLVSSKFSCVIPSPRTPLISPFLHV